MVKCCICGLIFKRITNTHLNKIHHITSYEFLLRYPKANRGLIPWNKDKTKYTNPSLMKMSQGLSWQKRWNFSSWQERNRIRLKKIREKRLIRNNILAELMGVILGDGNLTKMPRTEVLRVICNSKDKSYINHVVTLIEKVFNKKPAVHKRKNQMATDISLYTSNIGKRLELPTGNKIKNNVRIPSWIKTKERYMISCLKGLFETDGCFQKDPSNYAQYIELKCLCSGIRKDAHLILIKLGYNPQISSKYVRLARKEEVYSFKQLIRFREY